MNHSMRANQVTSSLLIGDTTHSIMAFSIITLSIITFSIIALSIMAFSLTTHSIMGSNATLQIYTLSIMLDCIC